MFNAQPIRTFIDSDVVISSLLSSSGAAYALLHNTAKIELHISNYSVKELETVVSRLNIDIDKLHELIATRLNCFGIDLPYEQVQRKFAEYTRDEHDSHIVAGAVETGATFLITYNIRHFVQEKLNQDFRLIVLTPGLFLQYLRSL